MKYYCIADPHGFYDEMIFALKEKGFFEEKLPYKLIICGDILDRGPKPKEICDFLERLILEDKLIFIRGNHEDLIEEFIDNIDFWVEYGLDKTHHFINGTVKTVLDLTGDSYDMLCLYPKRTAKKMENSRLFKKILPHAVDYFETEKHIFIHGWFPCCEKADIKKPQNFAYREKWRESSKKDWEVARWVNGMVANAYGIKEKGKTVVCGHYRASYGHEHYGLNEKRDNTYLPFYSDGIIALDAQTCVSGRVNCIVIED